MIGDKLTLKDHHLIPAEAIYKIISGHLSNHYIIAIGGESGCGKSTLAVALQNIIQLHGRKCYIFHMDDYFKLPPKSNHERRLESLENVGPHEVDLQLLQQHIDLIKHGADIFQKPLVNYNENKIYHESVDLNDVDVVIVEGTYTLDLEVDMKIFMERNYIDTLQNRIERARDPLTPFVETVLEIEHNIIKLYAHNANILVDKNYNIKFRE